MPATRPGQRSKVFVDVSQHNEDFRRRDGQNEIWDFTIGPHDGNLYLLLGDEPHPNVGRVRIYEPNVTLGDPPLGDLFLLPVTHGTQTRIEFFPN